MKLIIAMLTLMVTAFVATAADPVRWTNAEKALGLATDSNEFRTIVAAYGSFTRSQSGKSEFIRFKASGIAFQTEKGRVVELQLQLAPGKEINDAGYSEELPKDIEAAKRSQDDAIRIFGHPLRDVRDGYRKLTYLIGENIMTLHYGPSLDYVTLTNKPTSFQH